MTLRETFQFDLTEVDTTPNLLLLGAVRENVEDPTTGFSLTVGYGKNNSGGALAAGDVVQWDLSEAAGTLEKVTADAASARVAAVARHAVADGAGAWFIIKGRAEVTSTGAITAGAGIAPGGTAGKAEAVTGNTEDAFGFAVDTFGGAATATCYVNCLGWVDTGA